MVNEMNEIRYESGGKKKGQNFSRQVDGVWSHGRSLEIFGFCTS